MNTTDTIDIYENEIQKLAPEILDTLLVDHTATKIAREQSGNPDAIVNIIWGTSDYEHLGKGYECQSQILPELITGENSNVIMPRVFKSKLNQSERSREMAEVFTPSWICNAQNNLVDNAWFGREDVFNHEQFEEGKHVWIPTADNIVFDTEEKTWKDYVRDIRLEITCGEAPYLVSRYDTTTGEPLPIENRIGILDRKLRVVNENTDNTEDWLTFAQQAFMSTYGFEWQGDNLQLARVNLLYTFVDYFSQKFGHAPQQRSVKYIAYIISWNLWQMDGLKFCLPGQEPKIPDLFDPIGNMCLVRDWKCKDKTRRDVTFKSLVKS